jgi:hypothetical protein
MSDQPLVPFHPPEGLGVSFAVSPAALTGWLFVAALLFWAIYTLVAIYHWIKFSHAASVAYPAIMLHLAVSGGIILYALSGFV